ncbi:MAG: adenosylcobalamin-dependent ribonucleoside-diphosphate reductase [Thermodesulfobacteriota bacterium]
MKERRSKPSPRLSPAARLVLSRRYLKRDLKNRVVETPAQMFERVARTVAQAEALYDSPRTVAKTAARFYEVMAALDFLPNSPTLMNAGRELGQLSACFVLPVEDSIESIFNAVRDTALIHKSGGGTGFSFSSIRPANDLVQSTHGVSSGPISFMHVFDVATETIKQGGVRRGANMGLLSVHHPDILEFITAKSRHPGRFTNFNLSVAVTRRFMEAVRRGGEYDLINPHTGLRTARLPAVEVFDQMVRSAWTCGDPGLIFLDRINAANPLPHLGPLEATNPCGEQPLLPYESCTLGSINLARFLQGEKIDFDRLGSVIHLAIHFLDNVIDVNRFPLPQIREMTRKNRKIGLGVMGLADLLIKLELAYDSEEALATCRRLMAFIQAEARGASIDLARKRGNFPSFEGSVYHQQGLRHLRHATTTTIAPTGTLSLIAGCSSGIEPLFALAYRRRILDDQEVIEVHPWLKRLALRHGFWSESLAQDLAGAGSIGERKEIPEKVRRIMVTAHDLDPLWHLKVQAAFQAHTDNAVSKTVNLPASATPETVRGIFLAADEWNLKGVTVYRDGSKAGQVLSFGVKPIANGQPMPRTTNGGPCPECGSSLGPDQGCWLCPNCGYSHCH